METSDHCALVCMGAFASMCMVLSLFLHQYCKHGEDPHKLECPERCFQPEDVCVCCDCSRPWHRRCSHEMWIVLFAALFTWCYWELKDCD